MDSGLKKLKGLHLFKHGYARSRTGSGKHSITYNSWRGMRERCKNPNHKNFELYKNRLDDPRWENFMAFFEDMGERPSKEYQLDRIDNTKGYCKENCRWATIQEQHRNHSRNVMVEFYGTFCAKDLAIAMEVNYTVLRERLSAKWEVEDALMECRPKYKMNRIRPRTY